MASELDRKASTVVGGMSLRVEKTGRAPEEAGGSRMQFLYEVRAGEHVYRGTDLYAGVGMDVSASRRPAPGPRPSAPTPPAPRSA